MHRRNIRNQIATIELTFQMKKFTLNIRWMREEKKGLRLYVKIEEGYVLFRITVKGNSSI